MNMQKPKPHSAPRAAVGAVVIDGGRVLLIKRKYPPKKGKWAIPGGSVNLGETLQTAAEREIREETGLTIEAKQPIYTFDLIEHDSEGRILFHFVIVDLHAEYISGEPYPADDVIEARWFGPGEIEGLDITENTKKLLIKTGFLRGGIG
jgi:8-oxo-dGTP diphosphatase